MGYLYLTKDFHLFNNQFQFPLWDTFSAKLKAFKA